MRLAEIAADLEQRRIAILKTMLTVPRNWLKMRRPDTK
jgi:hypothetical protein